MDRRQGITSFGATLFVVLVMTVGGLFLWRVWTYYNLIRSGGNVALPQFATQFTAAGGSSGPTLLTGGSDADDPSIGPADAKLTVVEFLDYQCPFCGQASSIFREASAAYGDRVRFVVRDFPVPELHEEAVIAAEAAGCAQSQGKFWQMHDRLFNLKGVMPRAAIDDAAEQSGVDMEVFKACMDGHARIDEIEADAIAGQAAGVRGTPTFFFNGSPVEGVIPKEAFDAIINRYLNPS